MTVKKAKDESLVSSRPETWLHRSLSGVARVMITNQLGMLCSCAVVQKVAGARSTPHQVKDSSSAPLPVELSQVAADR